MRKYDKEFKEEAVNGRGAAKRCSYSKFLLLKIKKRPF